MNDLMGLICTNYEESGFGTLVSDRPVASLPFGGRYRLVDFPLSNMVNSGIHTVGLITPYMYRSLLDHVGSGKAWELGGKTSGLFILPGTIYGQRAGAGKLIMRDLQVNRPFFEKGGGSRIAVSASSRIMNIDYRKVATYHDHCDAHITLIYKKNFAVSDPGVPALTIDEAGRVTAIEDGGGKPCNCYLDSFIISAPLLLNLTKWYSAMGFVDILDIFKDNLKMFKVYAYEFDGYVGAVDDLKSYMHCSMDLLSHDVREELFRADRPISTKVQDHPPAKYGKNAKIINSYIASGSIIEGHVENSIISRSVYIGPDAVVKNSIVMPDCTIGREAKIDYVICDKRVKIEDFVILSGTEDAPLSIGKGKLGEADL